MQTAQLGSISHGTMRPDDLIPRFLEVLRALDQARADKIEAEYADVLAALDSGEDVGYLVESLFDALNCVAPSYCYFVSNEGDGSDYGFWISWDSLKEDTHCGYVIEIPAGDEWPNPLPEDTQYVLVVTDHGNATLYGTNGEVIWSVV